MTTVFSEVVAGEPEGRAASSFWWRLTDNLFRRLGWYLLPVILMTVIGFTQASNTLQLFGSGATLSASANPLVPEQQISGTARNIFESPAAATSRIINERLRTDSFLLAVVDEAGLSDAVDSGLLPLEVVRSSVWASANGDSILNVSARWGDPQVAHDLVASTVNQYQVFLGETVARDAAEAETFYTTQLEALEHDRAAAEERLSEYLLRLPPLDEGEVDYPIDIRLEVERLSDGIVAVEGQINDVKADLNAASLARVQQTSEAGQSFTVIDPPRVPSAPESVLVKQITLTGSFFLMGLVIAIGALLVTTALDRSVAAPDDLLAIDGITLVATVPTVKLPAVAGQAPTRARRGRRRRRVATA